MNADALKTLRERLSVVEAERDAAFQRFREEIERVRSEASRLEAERGALDAVSVETVEALTRVIAERDAAYEAGDALADNLAWYGAYCHALDDTLATRCGDCDAMSAWRRLRSGETG